MLNLHNGFLIHTTFFRSLATLYLHLTPIYLLIQLVVFSWLFLQGLLEDFQGSGSGLHSEFFFLFTLPFTPGARLPVLGPFLADGAFGSNTWRGPA